MGANQVTLKKSTDSVIEKRSWWKKQRIHKTKKKSMEFSNGVLMQREETTKEFRGKDSYQYTKVVLKKASNGNNKYIQEEGHNLPQTFYVSRNKENITNSPSESKIKQPQEDSSQDSRKQYKENNTNSPSESKIKQPQEDSSQDSVLTLLHNSGYGRSISYNKQNALNSSTIEVSNDSRMGFNQRMKFVKSNVEKPYTESKSTENNVYSSTDPSVLHSNETDMIKQQCSLDSLLGANSKTSSYDTKLKVFNDSLCSQNHETQFMNKLSFDGKKVGGDSCSNNMQSLKYLKTVESCDDEETEHFMTSVKEGSSYYSDSDLYSDECSHRITQTSDESFSISACESNRCGPDSSIFFKQVDKYTDIPERQCQKLINHSGGLVQSNVDQISDKESVVRIGKHCENSRSVIKCQSVCGETVSKKIEYKSDEIEPETAQLNAGNICQTGSMKCQYASAELHENALPSNVQKAGEKSVQVEKGMQVNSVSCCETVPRRDTTQTTVCVFSALLDFDNATVIDIYYQCHWGTTDNLESTLCTHLVLASFYSSINKVVYKVNPNVRYLHILIQTVIYACKPVNEVIKSNSFSCIFVVVLCHFYAYIRNIAEVADKRKNLASSSGTSDAQISVVKFVWEEGQKLICMLYFLENIKRITLKLDNRKDSAVKERKQLADKETSLIYAGKIDSIDDETIGKVNLVQKSPLNNENRGTRVSDRNFSAQNIEENYDQVEINSEISALQNQDNIADNQTVHIDGIEKCENTGSCKTKALKSKQSADIATNMSVEMVEINDNKNGKTIEPFQGDNKTMEEALSAGLGVSKLALDRFYPKLEEQRNINDDPEIADIKDDIKLSESVVKDSQKIIDEESILEERVESEGVKYLQSTGTEASVAYSSFSSCIESLARSGVRSVDEVAIGSTKRMPREGRNKIKKYKRKIDDKLIAKSTDQQQLFSAVKNVILSDKASRDGKLSSRKKHRVKKQRTKNPRIALDSDALKPILGVKKKHSKTIQPKEKDLLGKFCKKCHQQTHKLNADCRSCQSVRAEIETDMFPNHVSNFDSGIASMISSKRSLILSGMESVQNITCEGKKETRKKILDTLFNLGVLNQQLQKIIKGLNFDAVANVNHSIIAFPGLQSYFESLRNGVTPSFQERMTYEWLRLMSFSSYNGGGCPVHLARDGFFHHQGNETRCFCCNASYSNWTYTDDVQAVHRRISPDCPFVVQGVESNRNTPVENNSTGNQSYPPSTQQSVVTPSISSTETPGSHSSVTHGGFSFGSGMPGMSQTRTHDLPRFSFYPDTSANFSEFRFTEGADQAAEGAYISSQVTSQLGALTIQQSAGAQQPTEEPVSGNPLIVPTQPSQIARQTDGDAQLIVSAQQPPEANETQQNTTGNQGTSGASSSRPPPSGTESADILPIGTLKHPRYGNLNVRMSSFASWPSHLNQTPRQMAYAGFFHPGVADFARCFCCGGGLRNWEADDDPMVEHARWYPRCEYINKLKGTHFVQAVLRRHREHMAERQREQERSNDNSFTSPDPMTTEVAANLLEMGFTQERAREAILTVRRLRGRSEVTAEEVTTWMLDDDNTPQSEPTRAVDTAGTRDTVRSEERSEQRNVPSSSSSSGSNSEPTVTTQDATSGNTESSAETQGSAGGGDRQVESKTASNDKTEVDSSADETAGSGKADSSTSSKSKSKKGKKSKSRKGHSPSGESATSSQGDIDTKSLKEENKLLKQMQVCKICMDKYVSVTFLPCGHLVCCEECARSMRKCPICRKRIKGQVKTFMS